MIKLLGYTITPTVFPDKTSQVWKLPESLIKEITPKNINSLMTLTIEWEFENEAEFMQVAQLKTLLHNYTNKVELFMPYLPYGRQDKEVSNESTFALTTFGTLLQGMGFSQITTVDAHSEKLREFIVNLVDIKANKFINKIPQEVVCYPDKGALHRYAQYTRKEIYLEKERDPFTGTIIGMKLSERWADEGRLSIKGKDVLIVDDICDGGRTFVEAANLLKKFDPKSISLYVTHGIFSKGLEEMKSAGISKFYTYKGAVE